MATETIPDEAGPTYTQPLPQGLRAVRHSRRELRVELHEVARWRRLLRARIEIAVASAAPPQPLGQVLLPYVALDAQLALPMHRDLEAALRSGLPMTEIGRLDTLRDLDNRLATYEAGIEAALETATEDFITRLSMHPANALDLQGLHGVRDDAPDPA